MAKLGPLAKCFLCCSKGVLVRLMTYFCLVLLMVLLTATVGAKTVDVEAVGADAVGAVVLALGLVLEQLDCEVL